MGTVRDRAQTVQTFFEAERERVESDREKMKARSNKKSKNTALAVARRLWPRKKYSYITKRRKTLADLYKTPTYRERIQQYVFTSLVGIFTQIKQNFRFPKIEFKADILKKEPAAEPVIFSPIRKPKEEITRRPFITQPRLVGWSAWDGVDEDLKIELEFSQPRVKNEYESTNKDTSDFNMSEEVGIAESTPVKTSGPINYDSSGDSGLVSLASSLNDDMDEIEQEKFNSSYNLRRRKKIDYSLLDDDLKDI